MSGRKKFKNNSGKRVMLDSQSVRQLQVYRYPFSTATSNPKIPDGKLTQSTGIKVQNVKGNLTGEDVYILLFPGLNTHCLIINGATNEYLGWSVGVEGTHTGYATANGNWTKINGWTQWRLVSKALCLKCIVNDDKNNGYFEAVRFPINQIDKSIFIEDKKTDTGKTALLFTHVQQTLLDEIKKQGNWLLNPLYQSGKVKNIGQFEFRLQPQKIEHDMIAVPNAVEFKANEFTEAGIMERGSPCMTPSWL